MRICYCIYLSSYETTPKWHGFLMTKLAALAAGGRAEQRTAEYRISNRRISKDGFAALSLFLNRQNTSLRHSTFMIRYSIFAFSKFLLRSDWTLAARGNACMKLHEIERQCHYLRSIFRGSGFQPRKIVALSP